MSGQFGMQPAENYAAPVSYFIPTKSEVGKLQKEAGELRKVVDNKDNPWIERTRAESRLHSIETRIQAFRADEKQAASTATAAQQVEKIVGSLSAAALGKEKAPQQPSRLQRVNNAEGRWVLSDGGEVWSWIKWDAKQRAANAAAGAPSTVLATAKAAVAEFMAPVPYFAAQ